MAVPSLPVLAFVTSLLVFSTATQAARATPAQMKAHRRGSTGLLDDPVANYAKIPPLFMARNPDQCVTLRGQYTAMLPKAKTDHERAALHYLLAEASWQEAIGRMMRDRDRQAMNTCRPAVVEHYLAAFKHAAKEGGDAKLASHVSAKFLRCIGSGVCSGTEGEMLGKRAIAEFIDPVEKRTDITVRQNEQVSAYKKLGILARLWVDLPAEPPEDQKTLDGAFKEAVALKCDEKVLLYADEVLRRYNQSVKPVNACCLDAARILARTKGREGDAWQWLVRMAEDWQAALPVLYRLAPELKPDLPRAERLAFLDRYIVHDPKLLKDEFRRDSVFFHYFDAAALLMNEKSYSDALRYIDPFIMLPHANQYHQYSRIVRWKRDCLAHLGKTE